MSNVLFKRGDSKTRENTPIQDGLLFFDEENCRIYMDNGTSRFQYGGTVDLIANPIYANKGNVFSAEGALNTFARSTSVIDDKAAALAVTKGFVPLGCLAFKETVGNNDYSQVADGTLSGCAKQLKGEELTGSLGIGETSLVLQSEQWNENSFVDVYTDTWKASPKDVQVDSATKKITLSFSAQTKVVNVRVLVRNM